MRDVAYDGWSISNSFGVDHGWYYSQLLNPMGVRVVWSWSKTNWIVAANNHGVGDYDRAKFWLQPNPTASATVTAADGHNRAEFHPKSSLDLARSLPESCRHRWCQTCTATRYCASRTGCTRTGAQDIKWYIAFPLMRTSCAPSPRARRRHAIHIITNSWILRGADADGSRLDFSQNRIDLWSLAVATLTTTNWLDFCRNPIEI